MAYKLELTAGEKLTIAFVASRGYAEQVAALFTSFEVDEQIKYVQDEDHPNENDLHIFIIPEHMVWNILDELDNNGGHHFGPVSKELTAKLYKLVDSIV
jgi:hypothetical protein